MALSRFGRGWSEDELRAYLDDLKGRPVNFDDPPEVMTVEHGWTIVFAGGPGDVDLVHLGEAGCGEAGAGDEGGS